MNKTLAVIGMGYVGMPIAIEFAKKMSVYGFDINKQKVNLYKQGIDPTNEVGSEAIKNSSINFTSDEEDIRKADFIIVAVPTPINQDKSPNLTPVISASELIGRNLKENSYIIFESTVYPGVTEDICIPILESTSGLKCGKDFHVGYSPERINPGDKVHRLTNIKKVVGGQTPEETEVIANLYSMVVEAGVVKVRNIKTAEATKVIENSQRDINIAFMNEVAMIFDKMEIDTLEVVEAMNSKWNALGFTPGLVGGHCIGVDPYYFIYEAEKIGYHSELISSGRRINDYMSKFVAENTIKSLINSNKKVRGSKILVLGLTFKENTPDSRNSKIVDLINALKEYNVNIEIFDPLVDKDEVLREYDLKLLNKINENSYDAIIVGVNHDIFKDYDISKLMLFMNRKDEEKNVIIDIKGKFSIDEIDSNLIEYWRL
ncbi:nucleotide sugar dehydrogenase [Macrococcus capreoli]